MAVDNSAGLGGVVFVLGSDVQNEIRDGTTIAGDKLGVRGRRRGGGGCLGVGCSSSEGVLLAKFRNGGGGEGCLILATVV